MSKTEPEVVVVGSYIQDLAFQTQVFPAPGETRIGTFKTGPGGKGFNQAVACGRLDVETLFIGAIGQDAFGEVVKSFAAGEEHLTCAFWEDGEHSSGAASIVVDATGQNLITVALGANDYLPADFVRSQRDAIGRARILLCQLENNIEATREALSIAREAGATTILNPAPINEGFTADLLDLVDVATPNETEFLYMLERLGTGNGDTPSSAEELVGAVRESPERIHRICREVPVKIVVITLGEAGCFVSDQGDTDDSYYHVPAKVVSTVDSTGAGDAFSGGLAAGLALKGMETGGSLREAVEFANQVAALSTTKPGTSPAMPYAGELR